jgi:stringent starvation protein B
MSLTSTRPYLLRAFYDWIVDNSLTPYLLVDAEYSGVMVPQQYVADGKIILNVSPSAVREFVIDQDGVRFEARFSGEPCFISFPIFAATAIYASENGKGMVFPEEESPEDEKPKRNREKRPKLTVVE